MSQQRKGGLGRGLAALIPTGPDNNGPGLGNNAADVMFGEKRGTPGSGESTPPMGSPTGVDDGAHAIGAVYREIPQREIQPNPQQPRSVFDEDALHELVHSLREFGLMQPIVVRRLATPIDAVDDATDEQYQVKYQLVMGERRWRASQATVDLGDRQIAGAGLPAIPAIVRETADGDMLRDALLENIHRVQLNPLEEAAAYQQLLEEFGVTHEQLADRLGRSRPVISNMIRLLNLPVPVQRRVAAGVLSAGHARALLSLKDDSQAEELAARIVKEGLSVRATEEAVTLSNRDDGPTPTPPTSRKPMKVAGLQEVADSLSDRLDTRVTVSVGKRKGKMVIEFGSVADLERIVELINKK